jgi:co-chaperonin GroES (HSP10)
MGGGHAGKRRELADVMVNTMHADLAGLQECMNEDEMAAGFAGRMQKAPGTDTFNCIFYKPGVVEFLGISGRRYLGDYARDAYSQRYVSYAKMRFAGVSFWLFSSHWCIHNNCQGHEAGLRHKHSAQVITSLREELGGRDMPAIITADTNSHMDGLNDDDGIVWLLGNGFEIAHQGAWPFDVIFVSTGDWHVTARIDGPSYPSDHPSLSVKVAPLAATTTTTTTTSKTTISTTTLTTTVTTTSAASTNTVARAVQAGDTIWLRAHTGKYLTVQGTELHAKWNDRLSWQAFAIEKESSKNVNIQSGDSVYLRAHTGRHVTVQGTTVHAQWNNTGSWERFVIEKSGAGGRIYPNDTIYLRAHTGKYVSVQGATVLAKWENQGSWEALLIESDETTGVTQETGYTGADNGTSWEYFEGYNCYPGHGAEDIFEKSPMRKVLSLQECRVACEIEPFCEGIVMMRDRPRDQCWLRRNVDATRCLQSTPYDFWLLDKKVLLQ